MELKQSPVYKNHGYRASISAAFSMLYDNIKLILSKTWMYAAIYALLLGVCSVVMPVTPYGYADIAGNTLKMLCISGMPLLLVAAQLFFHSSITVLLTGRAMKWNLLRNLKAAAGIFFTVSVVAVLMTTAVFMVLKQVVPEDSALIAAVVSVSCLVLIMVILVIPFVYGMMRYIMEPDARLRSIFTTYYVAGMRHWGYLFAVMVTVAVIAFVSLYIMSLPAIVLSIAENTAMAGVYEYGDELSLSAYFPYMKFFTTVITSYVSLYISIAVIFAAYYVYGSINVREETAKAKK